jgi:D-glycero-beta-D-manno-heptose-7-phosphate kinase
MTDIKSLFESFQSKKVIVIGDIMIDTYIQGTVSRMSPEADVPVVDFQSRTSRLGGAANVALNLKSLGAEPIICTVIGKDDNAEILLKLINESQLTQKGIVAFDERLTTVKTRVIGNDKQLIRVDHERAEPISSSAVFALVNIIKEFCLKDDIDAIIFQDYNKGVLTAELIEQIIAFANEQKIVTTVDPKSENFLAYKNVTLFKPNLKELAEGTDSKISVKKQETFLKAIVKLREILTPTYIFVTLSENGVYINDEKNEKFIEAHERNIVDVSGAGDTVISVATLCLVAECEPKLIADIANLAGGLVCEHVGVVSIDKEVLLKEAKKIT